MAPGWGDDVWLGDCGGDGVVGSDRFVSGDSSEYSVPEVGERAVGESDGDDAAPASECKTDDGDDGGGGDDGEDGEDGEDGDESVCPRRRMRVGADDDGDGVGVAELTRDCIGVDGADLDGAGDVGAEVAPSPVICSVALRGRVARAC